jgi:hypothetical protein
MNATAKETTHTPGPWRVEGNDVLGWSRRVGVSESEAKMLAVRDQLESAIAQTEPEKAS